MRIVQLIDSLDAGGAERMAVNYANALHKKFGFSALCTTREEGQLKAMLLSEVEYQFLGKKKVLDFKSILKLCSFVKKNKIEFVHAHSSSFFTAVLLKFVYPKIKVVWHDHYGNSEFLKERNARMIKLMSFFFYSIISVNKLLKEWAIDNLYCKKVIYLPNFASFADSDFLEKPTMLQGAENKRILCLANLRPQKGHFFLLDVAEKVKLQYPDWSFHLVGKDFGDDYSNSLQESIKEKGLNKNVFIYGSKDDVQNIIKQSEICILTSKSEGLPVALLEYGFNEKAVVVTKVGEIGNVVNDENGFLVEYGDVISFTEELSKQITSPELRMQIGQNLYKTIIENYSEEAILDNYIRLLT